MDIAVTDASGRPVADADVTAYGWTARFKYSSFPAVPYLGKQYPYNAPGSYLEKPTDRQKRVEPPIDWSRWAALFRLDTLAYYKLLHPATLYFNRVRMPDSVTQVAPFVSRKGQPEHVHLVYIDERLVYFEGAQQIRHYSFAASPGFHTLRLRVRDRELRIDSIFLPAGMKTIVGIKDDTLNAATHFPPMPGTPAYLGPNLLSRSLMRAQKSYYA